MEAGDKQVPLRSGTLRLPWPAMTGAYPAIVDTALSRSDRGGNYRNKRQAQQRSSVVTTLGAAALVGLIGGVGTVVASDDTPSAILAKVQPVALGLGLARARAPQAGDYWPRCAAARAAGTAPIYAGEPEYREGLDGDSNGFACEPYRER